MIIATKEINMAEIRKYINDLESLVYYVESLVPRWIAHNEYIIANQRFYTAVTLRNTLTITYQQRNDAAEILVKGIHIFGNPTTVTTIADILSLCDKQALIEMIKNGNTST